MPSYRKISMLNAHPKAHLKKSPTVARSVTAEAVGGVILAVFVTVVLVALHAQVGGEHGIVNFLGSAELPIVASVLTLDSLREAIGSIYDGEHRQNVFVAGIIVFVVALLLASKGVDMEVAHHQLLEAALETARAGNVSVVSGPVEQTMALPLWVVWSNVGVWVSAIALSIWNRSLALTEKRHFISRENVEAFMHLLDAVRSGDKVARALLEEEQTARDAYAQLAEAHDAHEAHGDQADQAAGIQPDAPGNVPPAGVRTPRAVPGEKALSEARTRHAHALDALQLYMRRAADNEAGAGRHS